MSQKIMVEGNVATFFEKQVVPEICRPENKKWWQFRGKELVSVGEALAKSSGVVLTQNRRVLEDGRTQTSVTVTKGGEFVAEVLGMERAWQYVVRTMKGASHVRH